ncbi:glucuronate isomerase [Spirosoma sordidisoli]|uniref:Uronate isomerase n=1 Tax=Spirosoma sordidisoli TaxID=2502893 RepID=A0A4Q2UHK1_9BACT|nr:glucuronate isomerase [Spirosoma sordidisoli]RYC68654.1 glucuronate isomerase [Spirosoma sordidisoli]
MIDLPPSHPATRDFLDENFILETETARYLYTEFVRDLPIIDYHNHLSPAEVALDKRYDNMTEIWLQGDHYKWRAMRANGVPEALITGSTDPWRSFNAWAHTVPYTMRNPLYHWTHMELKKPFGIGDLLNEASARSIYDQCNEQLQSRWTARALLTEHKVQVICTTDEPADDLRYHQQLADEGTDLTMLPTFRPDALFPASGQAWRDRVAELASVSGLAITSLDTFLEAMQRRIDFFHETGCRAADHGLAQMPLAAARSSQLDTAFRQLLAGQTTVTPDQIDQLTGCILLELGRMYHQRGWVQQFHLGALRQVNTRLTKQIGINIGVDSINDLPQTARLARFLDTLDQSGQLTKTVLYNLNPADNETFATMIGNFQGESTPVVSTPVVSTTGASTTGRMQWGSAWWFLDQKDGMETQLNVLSNMGLLSRFIGMVTDSRSLLSFSRHDYFRRILCNIIGTDVEKGLLPRDLTWLGQMTANIAYHNVSTFFDWKH